MEDDDGNDGDSSQAVQVCSKSMTKNIEPMEMLMKICLNYWMKSVYPS